VRILILETEEGQARENVKSLLQSGRFINGIEFPVLTLGQHFSTTDGKLETRDYFEFLQSAQDVSTSDVVDRLSQIIIKNLPADYIMIPLDTSAKGSVIGYVMSWVLSHYEPWSLRGAIYYQVGETSPLIQSFEDLFEFQKIVTKEDDTFYLDMPDKEKMFFKNLRKPKEGK